MRKILIFVILSGVLILLLRSPAWASSWFGKEKEKEVKDEYLEQLFRPDIPHEWVKILEDQKGNRFIAARLKEKFNNEIINNYRYVLLSRGVNLYRTYHYGVHSWQTTLTDFAIIITRRVEGDPNAVEISESVVLDPKKKRPVESVLIKDREIRIAVEKDLGKRWRRVQIIPEKELDYPDPEIGRYPGSKLRQVYDWGGGRASKFYVSTAPVKDIFEFYHSRAKERYGYVSSIVLKNLDARINDPRLHSLPFEIFGIKSICQNFDLRGYDPFVGKKSLSIDILRSLDINLKHFIEIFIKEN